MPTTLQIDKILARGDGILRMVPNWVPRQSRRPGRRLRLHPDDYYCFGLNRGAIIERWFSSLVPAMNGPLTSPGEGLSKVDVSGVYSDAVYFREVAETLGEELIGKELWKQYGQWPMYAKFFDNEWPLGHHLHLDDQHAQEINMLGKPEAYYFPAILNTHSGTFPATYFGYNPGVTREDVKKRLLMYETGDNRITELSRAYRLALDTGWNTPPGVVHAPGSLLTYEPQWNSDVASIQENVIGAGPNPREQLVKDLPEKKKNSIDAIMETMDWEANTDPDYYTKYFRPPLAIDTGSPNWSEKWIVYATPCLAAKETRINPGMEVVIKDAAAYGCIIIQGHGEFGAFRDAEAAGMLRFNQLSGDEYFVSDAAARTGVRVVNHSRHEPMVILRHFGPNSGAPNKV